MKDKITLEVLVKENGWVTVCEGELEEIKRNNELYLSLGLKTRVVLPPRAPELQPTYKLFYYGED